MIRSLHFSKRPLRGEKSNTAFLSGISFFPVLFFVFLLLPHWGNAQLIVETFENNSWTSASLQTSVSSTRSISSVATSNQQTISTWNGGAGVTTITGAAANTNTSSWIWAFTSASTTSFASTTSGANMMHSTTTGMRLNQNAGFLITPIISNGISQVTFWLNNPNTGGATGLYVGLRTNVTGTGSTLYPTTASNASLTSTNTGNPYQVFSLQTTTSTGNIPAGPQEFTYTIASSLASVGGQMVFFAEPNTGGSYADLVIDDITIYSETPYLSSGPQSIPGIIKPEDYDLGGEGYSYHDNDAANQGGQYRLTEGVDIEAATGDGTNAYDIGFGNPGEYMNYTVNVATTGTYTLGIRYASNTGNTRNENFLIDGTSIVSGADVALPATGGWQTYSTVSTTTFTITVGKHILTVYSIDGGPNYNYFTFTLLAASPTITLTTSPVPSECYSSAASTLNLPYTATTGSPTTYSISGWSNAGFSNIVNASLPASPIAINVPAGMGPGTYTANLTVSNGSLTSIAYPISITLNGGTGPGLYTIPASAYAYYKMSGSAADSIGNDPGTLKGVPVGATDRFGNSNAAYSFNGTNQYISTSVSIDAMDPTTFTESIWFKTTTPYGALMGFQNSIDSTPAGTNHHDRVLYLSAGKVVYTIYNNNNNLLDSISSPLTYNDGNWHMASVVVNGTTGFTLYVDGMQVAASNGSYGFQTYSTGAYLVIGYHDLDQQLNWLYPAYYNFFTGSLDDAVLDNTHAYTAAQVYALYTGIKATSNSPVCMGSTLNLGEQFLNTGGTTTYSWTGPAGYVSTAANATRTNFAAADSGNYYITATGGSLGCLSSSVDVSYTSNYWAYKIPTGTTSYYNFSSNANDSFGVNNGTLQNAPSSVADRYGNAASAYSFNGSSQYISTATSYTNPTNYSISVWFKTTSSNGVLVGFDQAQTGGPGANYDRDLFMYNGRIFFGIYNSGVDTISSPLTYNDGNWHLAAATGSSTNGMNLYVDGILVASNASYTTPQNYSGYWRIGYNGAWVVDYFTGSLDGIAISNTSIFSAAAIAEEYFGLNPGSNSPVCPGTPLSLTEGYTATGGTYAWTGPGYTNATQNPTIASPANSGEYYITVTTVAGCSTTDSLAAIAGTNYIWTGATSSNWSTGSNWICGSVPGATDNATIPNVGPAHPEPVLTANTTINNVVDSPNATIGLAGYTFTINGIASGTGTFSGSSTSNMSFGGSSTGTVYFTGGSNTLQNITLTDGANITIGNALNIASTGIVTVGSVTGATLASGGNITLVSDNNGSASIGQVPFNAGTGAALSTISGIVNVQCYIHSTQSQNSMSSPRRAWRLLTAPVSNFGLGTATTIYNSWQDSGISYLIKPGVGTRITLPPGANYAGSGMEDGINGNYSCYTWTIGSQVLTKLTNTFSTSLSSSNTALASAANTGYFIFVRGDRDPTTVNYPTVATINNTTLNAPGVLQLGTQTFNSGSVLAANGLMLVGNPYASAVNFKLIAGDTTAGGYTSGLTNLTNRFYFWNSNLTGSQGVGNYECVDDASNSHNYTENVGVTVGATGANYGDLNIQSGQAFFVQAAAGGTASIAIKETDKTTARNFIFRPEQTTGEQDVSGAPSATVSGTLSLLNSDNSTNLTDGFVAQFKNGYGDSVDYLDAPKFGSFDESFSLSRSGQSLCIERREDLSAATSDTLFLTLKQMLQRDYQFNFSANIPNHPGVGAHLEDAYTDIHTPLNIGGNNTVNFTIDGNTPSQAQNRFMIVFGSVNIAPAYTNIKAVREGNTIVVNWTVSNDQSMNAYALQRSTDGGLTYTTVYIVKANHTTGLYNWIDTNPIIGRNYYRVISTDAFNEQSYSPQVYADISSLDPSGIVIYPNPIQNDQIGLALNNMAAGIYSYYLFDDLGQQIDTGTIVHSGGNATYILPLHTLVARAAYRLKIIEPDKTITVLSAVYIK